MFVLGTDHTKKESAYSGFDFARLKSCGFSRDDGAYLNFILAVQEAAWSDSVWRCGNAMLRQMGDIGKFRAILLETKESGAF